MSKTFFMFIVNNQKIQLPSFISFLNHDIQVVSIFNLLGVSLDSKLNFINHASKVCSTINKNFFLLNVFFIFLPL